MQAHARGATFCLRRGEGGPGSPPAKRRRIKPHCKPLQTAANGRKVLQTRANRSTDQLQRCCALVGASVRARRARCCQVLGGAQNALKGGSQPETARLHDRLRSAEA
eukprot:11404198-Alexandrium_andersonii.AAC.1